MVDVHVNLLKSSHTLSEKDYQRERAILKNSVITILVVVVLVIALSVWNLVLGNKLVAVETGLSNTAKEMQGLTLASASQIYLKNRLSLITGFLTGRGVIRESLQRVFSTKLDGVHVGAVAFESDDTLSINYVANSAKALENLITYYEADTGYFTQVVTSGLSRSKEGSYQLNVSLTLPKGEK